MKKMKQVPIYLTVRECADIYGCTSRNIRHAIQSGKLRAENITEDCGGPPRYRIAEDDFLAWERDRKEKINHDEIK